MTCLWLVDTTTTLPQPDQSVIGWHHHNTASAWSVCDWLTPPQHSLSLWVMCEHHNTASAWPVCDWLTSPQHNLSLWLVDTAWLVRLADTTTTRPQPICDWLRLAQHISLPICDWVTPPQNSVSPTCLWMVDCDRQSRCDWHHCVCVWHQHDTPSAHLSVTNNRLAVPAERHQSRMPDTEGRSLLSLPPSY